MRNRGIICLLLAACAFLAVLFIWPTTHSVRESIGAGISDPAEVVSLEVIREEGKYTLAYDGVVWRIVSPVVAETDASETAALLDALAFDTPKNAMNVKDVVILGRSLKDFGLNPPKVILRFRTRSGNDSTLMLGRDTPVGDEVYARATDAEVVFTLPRRLKDFANRPVDAFRSRKILHLAGEDIVSLSLRIPAKPFLKLERVDTGNWRIVLPSDAPADTDALNALTEAFRSEQIESYVSASSPEDVKGDNESSVTVSLTDAAGRKDAVVFGRPVPGITNRVYALVRNGTVPVTLSAKLKRICLDSGEKLRDLRLFPVQPSLLRTVSLTYDGVLYQLIRDGAEAPWRLVLPAETPADASAVDKVMRRIMALRQNDVALTSDGSTVRVAVIAEGFTFPSVNVPLSALTDDGGFNGLRSRNVLSFTAAEIRRLSMRTGSTEPTVVTFDERRGGWNARGSRADESAIAKTIAALSHVTALAVAKLNPSGDDFVSYGLSEPAFSFTMDSAGTTSKRFNLRIGKATPDGGRYATAGLSDTVFILSAETVTALTRPITE